MKILITGGAGFIGSHIVDKLIEQGYEVIIIDNLSTGKKENLNSKAKFFELSITDTKIEEVFKQEKPEFVIHQAAQVDVTKSIEDPIFDANINIIGSLNLLENCRKYGIKNIYLLMKNIRLNHCVLMVFQNILLNIIFICILNYMELNMFH